MISDNSTWSMHPMTKQHTRKICSWRYPCPYDIYNFDSWCCMETRKSEFADPLIREQQYRSWLDSNQELIGFSQFFPMLNVVRLGLGLRPDLCGLGLGAEFTRCIAEEAPKFQPHKAIDLEVLEWNERAIRTYQRAGFVITDTYERMTMAGPAIVHCMVWEK